MGWRRICSLVGLASTTALAPVSACGPFLYDNADLDQFSLIDPGILNTSEWNSFLAYSSPAFGLETKPEEALQPVIRSGRVPLTASDDVSNLVYDYNPGEDPVSVAANEAWWDDYFRTVRNRAIRRSELEGLLYEGLRPSWLNAQDADYLDQLSAPADDRQTLLASLAAARDPRLPEPLRHRHAFWAVRARAVSNDPKTVALFREFCPGSATDLPLARAQGWAASVLALTDPGAALKLWLDLLVHWPALRVQTFSSLTSLPSEVWASQKSPEARLAKFFIDARDFSPETLEALSAAEKAAGGNGTWTETVLYAMAEQIEAESGVFALFGLVDPHETAPRGLFTKLIDRAQALVTGGVQPATRTWWLLTSYLCLFDGDAARAAGFLARARTLPALNPAQDPQTELIAALIQMDAERDRDWSPALQTRVVQALDWGKTLNAPGRNRGLYHSVAVLAAQKYLARGRNPEAAMAFGLVQSGSWANPYRVQSDDGFWTFGWPSNNPVNLLMDALMSDADLQAWKDLLKAPKLDPLTERLAAHRFVSDRDLTWWQAHRALRRGEGEKAGALLAALGGSGTVDTALFSPRTFGYSTDLDPLDPASGRGMRRVGPKVLAETMARIEAAARTSPTTKALLAQGEFWFSLQLSGLPLLFADPPPVISFVNGNFEYYGYDGRDGERDAGVSREFPLGTPSRTDGPRRLEAFYRDEFSTLDRARRAFEAVVARRDNRDAEFRALLFLRALDGEHEEPLRSSRYDGLPLAEEFRSTCELFS